MRKALAKAATAPDDDLQDREFLKGRDLSKQERIGRPPVANMNDRNDDIEFM